MSDFVFKLNREGVRELLRGTEMQNVLINHAQKIATNAGRGYSVHIGPNRANVSVRTDSEEAYHDNLEHNTLEKAIRS